MRRPNFLVRQRGSGSTFLMLEDAVRQAKNGRPVFCFFNDLAQALDAQHTVDQMLGPEPRTGSVRCKVPDRIDWTQMHPGDRYRGLSRDTVFLFDHYLIERELTQAFSMWARYQRNSTGGNPFLSDEYKAQVARIPDEKRRELLDGEWASSEGQP